MVVTLGALPARLSRVVPTGYVGHSYPGDTAALAQRGFLDPQKLRTLKGPVGYRNLAFDLFTLAALLRDNWDKVSGKTAVQLSELDTAEILADRLLTAVGQHEQGPTVIAETTDIRQRAFSLFLHTYDAARRAVTYLRWDHDDEDKIAPSLYAGRNTGRRKATPTPTPAPISPSAAVGGGTIASASGHAGGDTDPVEIPLGLGLPGSNPYTKS